MLIVRALASILGLVALSACSSVAIERSAVPETVYREAAVPGFERFRAWGDQPGEAAQQDIDDYWSGVRQVWLASDKMDPIRQDILVLSGGADDGAFGVGLLTGWTEAGTRPEFLMVTGVSTGALIAPFAFLGPEYDDDLREAFFAGDGSDDVFELQLFRVLRGALSVADSGPLKRRIETFITPELLDALAVEHRKGRRLLVGTTNLDARRPVIWNITSIAASDNPRRLKLVRDVILASASIPGVAPPVLIDVTARGQTFQEMHVDGGVVSSVAFAPTGLSLGNPFEGEIPLQRTLYVVQNNKLRASYGPAEDSLFPIVRETVSEMIRGQARGDQIRLFYQAQRDGIGYRLAFVPESFEFEADGPFDPAYMRSLYELGYALAKNDYPWFDTPPGLDPTIQGRSNALPES